MSILYPDEFPVDEFVREFRKADGDFMERIKRLYMLLEDAGLAASIWETKVELYDDPLNVLKFPDDVKRLIITFTKPRSETAHDLICTWCSPAYLEMYQLPSKDVIGSRANASELHRDSPYRSWPRHLLPVDELSVVERNIFFCSEHLGYTVNRCLPECIQLWNLPEEIKSIPVFHGLKVDGKHDLFAIRCALMFIDGTRFLAINDRVDNGNELMEEVLAAKSDPSVLSRYILYLELDLLPDDLDLGIDFDDPELEEECI